MKEFFRKILIKITGIGWCDTPNIQISKIVEKNNVNNYEEEKEKNQNKDLC